MGIIVELLLTTEEAARYLGYASYTLRASRSNGMLSKHKTPKYIKLGHKSIRYKKSDLDEWIKNSSIDRSNNK